VGSKVLINEIHGYLQSQIVLYLLNYHVSPRCDLLSLLLSSSSTFSSLLLPPPSVSFSFSFHLCRSIWCTRHGESVANTMELLGGDSSLSPQGQLYSKALKRFGTDIREREVHGKEEDGGGEEDGEGK